MWRLTRAEQGRVGDIVKTGKPGPAQAGSDGNERSGGCRTRIKEEGRPTSDYKLMSVIRKRPLGTLQGESVECG